MATFYIQSSGEKTQYQMAWAAEIVDGDSIVTSTWTVSPTGPTLSAPGVLGTTTFVDVSGLSAVTKDYVITNTITLTSGDLYSSSIFIFVEQK